MISKRARRLVQFAVLALAAGEISAAAAEVLVLRAEGPRASRAYRTGTRHADNAIFELRPGDSLVVLGSGGTRNWRGPGYYSIVQPARPLVLANGQQVRVQTGVVRNIAPEPGVAPTDVAEYDIGRAGRLCVASGAAPLLWRPRGGGAARVTIATAGGASHGFDWAAGTSTMAWPSSLPVTDGATYILTSSRAARPVRITLKVLPRATSADTGALAARLLEARCTAQLDTLIATRADPDAPVLAEPAPRANRGGATRASPDR